MNSNPPKRMHIFVSLHIKLLLLFTLLFTVAFALAYYWFYNFATNQAIIRIGEDLRVTLVGAADRIDGDELIALYETGQPNEAGFTDDPRYKDQLDWLDTVHGVEPRAWLYTYLKGDEPNEMIFITDLFSRYNTDKAAGFREHYVADNAGPPYSGLEVTTLDLHPYTDKFGRWISGYTPIHNSAGEVVAGLGIDFQADYVAQVQQAIINSMITAFAVTYVILFLLVYLISRFFTRPIVNLTSIAELIGEGDYHQDLSVLRKDQFPDEIDKLAEVFEIMVGKVQKREQNLKRQVAQLRIEIDDAKRQRDVKKIVETDMFADLQSKAEAIRKRRRDKIKGNKPADRGATSTETKSDNPPTEPQPGLSS
ncbi:MAG: HAMP domain-containing protein [Anaerolineae bacterium]|nr:HAMP domain-containing protein [Anaerolineae bacterium]